MNSSTKDKINKAKRLFASNKTTEAIALFEDIINEAPNYMEAYLDLAQIHFTQGEKDKAKDICVKAITLDKDNTDIRLLLGIILKDEKQFDEALTHFAKVIEMMPQDIIALNNAAAIFAHQGNLDKAIECFDRAIQSDPTFLNTYLNKAFFLLNAKKHQETFDTLLEGLKNHVESPETIHTYQEASLLLVKTSKEVRKSGSFKELIDKLAKEIEKKFKTKIVLEEGKLNYLAAGLAKGNSTDASHTIRYNPEMANYEHAIVHELIGLKMELEAGAEKNMISHTTPEQQAAFNAKYRKVISRTLSSLSNEEVDNILNNLCKGITIQCTRCPIDLLIEDKIFNEYPEMRPMQLMSLLNLDRISIKSNEEMQNSGTLPKEFISTCRIMNMASSLLLKELFGIETISNHSTSNVEKKQAKDLFDMFKEYRSNCAPGEEFDLLLDFADYLGISNYLTLTSEKEMLKA
ncbi:MAG: tetratricopeptide repeat protein [Paludibacteraceae bacterium]|nr:tetratricopeptide repeat protein [Paludibacteraceae bacterium]